MLSVNGLLVHVDRLNKGKVVSKIQMTVTNKVEEIDIETSCRICLMKQSYENLFSAFGSNKMFSDFSIAAALLECFGIDISPDNNLPNCVCIKCASTTLQCYTFKKCIEKCQGYLEQWRKRDDVKEKSTNDNQNKENLVPGTSSILYNYLSSQNIQQGNVGSGNVVFVSRSISNKKHAIISTSSPVTHILAEHNYHKVILREGNTQDCVISLVDEDTLSPLREGNTQDCVISLVDEDTLSCENKELNESEMPENDSDNNSSVKKCTKQKPQLKKETLKKKPQSEKWWSKELGPPYECKLCGRSYGVRFRPFYTHVRMHRVSKSSCILCGKRFTRDKMVIHMRSHTKEKPYICDQCPARFTVEGNLKRHMVCHTGEKLYICDICGKSFTQSSSLNNHKQAHAGKTLFVCIYCGKTFKQTGSYSRHIYLHHNEKKLDLKNTLKDSVKGEEVQAEYKCPTCRKIFKRANSLRNHLQAHKDSKLYQCTSCFKKYSSQLNFKIHTVWHELKIDEDGDEQEDNWPCEFCKEIFTEKKALRVHILTHMSRPYLCTVCGKSFISRCTLATHNRIHTDERPHPCKMCDKTFRSINTLRQHERVHTGEKPHKCKICSRLFTQQQQLVSHMFTHTGEKRYVCPYCGKAFALNGNLTVHKRRHTGETPYVCNVCNKGFYDSSSLKKHKLGKHKDVSNNIKSETELQQIEAVENLLSTNFSDYN